VLLVSSLNYRLISSLCGTLPLQKGRYCEYYLIQELLIASFTRICANPWG
jgi:hypothetical protein